MTWLLIALVVFLFLIAHQNRANHAHTIEHIDRQVKHLERFIKMASQDEVNALTAQVQKVRAEVVAAIAALEEQVANGQPVDLTDLKAAVQGVDDLNPDATP